MCARTCATPRVVVVAQRGHDGLVLGEQVLGVLVLAVLDRQHGEVEPQLAGQLGVELGDPAP